MLNLNIESLQDSYYAKSKSSNFGISAGGGSSGASAGFNFGKTDSTTDSQWVNNQTSIIGDNNVNIRTKNNTNLIGSVVASNSDNLSLNTGSLTYSDLNDFYREETKGFNFGTSVGENRTDQKETNLHPQGSTTIGLTHTGREKEQITRATLGNGSIVIADNKDISDLNRDVDKSQEITKDTITGALNSSMTIDNRVFTSDGRKEIVNNFVNLPSNLVRAGAGAMSEAEEILETTRETIDKGVKVIGNNMTTETISQIITAPVSVGEGFFDFFVENDSKLYVYDVESKAIKETNDPTEAKNYYTNGIMNNIEDIKKFLVKNPDYVTRYGTNSGAAGDLIRAGLGKLFNWNGLTAQLGAESRNIANDLIARKDMKYAQNDFHSRGTVNGVGGLNILNYKGIQLDKTQSINANGPAVYETIWKNTSRNVIQERVFVRANDAVLGEGRETIPAGTKIGGNINYNHDDKDGVRKMTAPKTPWDPFVGIYNMITTPERHSISNYKK